MAGPLSGIGAGVQIPASSISSQSEQRSGEAARTGGEDTPRGENVQAQNAPVAETQGSDSDNQNATQNAGSGQDAQFLNAYNGEQERGSIVDITV